MKMGPLGNVKIVMRLKEEDKKRRVRVRMRKKESRLGRGKRANEEYRRMYTKRTKEKRRENKRKKRTRILQNKGAVFYEWKMETDNKGCTNSIFHLRGCQKITYYSPPMLSFFMYIFLGENICAPPMFYVIYMMY